MLYKKYIKRIFDVILSSLFLIILSPLILFVSLFLYFQNGGKVFFIQTRPGKDEKLFDLIKFRTMNEKTDKNGKLLPDAQRLTKIGKFIRSLSLDELPQLINVLKGDMSLVGPRPLLEKYLLLFDDRQKKRHSVKPGITGLAQVSGRNILSWQQRLELDVQYVEKINFIFDLKILFKTIIKVLKREGINNPDSVTMHPFEGNNKNN